MLTKIDIQLFLKILEIYLRNDCLVIKLDDKRHLLIIKGNLSLEITIEVTDHNKHDIMGN